MKRKDDMRAADSAGGSSTGGEAAGAELEWSARMARVFTVAGFSPRAALHPSRIEYQKMYGDAAGRTARVTAVVAKGISGEPAYLESFVITIQMHLAAAPESIQAEAPQFVSDDLRALVEALGAVDAPTAHDAVALDCAGCRKHTSEFIVARDDGRAYCRACYAKRGV